LISSIFFLIIKGSNGAKNTDRTGWRQDEILAQLAWQGGIVNGY
jgi:hypothetical protein